MKSFPRLTMLLFALAAVNLSLGATFTGTVRSVSGNVATVAMNGDVMPPAGARAEFFFKIPGLDEEISVATGSVLRIDRGDLLVTIENATGTLESGHLVRFIFSPWPPAASSPTTNPTPGETQSPAVAATEAGPTATPSEAARYFAEGYAKLSAHDFKGAIAAYTKAIELDPTEAKAYANRGSAYNALKQSERGLADLNESIRLNPNESMAHVIRGNCYADLRQFKRAIEDYDEAIRLDPKNASAYNDRGTVYIELGQDKIALEDFIQAIELDPAHVAALTNRATLYQAAGKTQLAKRDRARVKELKAPPKPTPARPEQNKEKSP